MINLNSEKKEYEAVPEGNHLGRLYQIIELGNVPSYKDPTDYGRQVRFTFELPEETRDFDGKQKPMVISNDYFVSTYPTSQMRKAIEGIRGKMKDEDFEEFNLKSLLGKFCMVNVFHKTSQTNGRTYANISALTPLPKAIKDLPEPFNKDVYLDYGEEWNQDVYDTLPSFLKEKMAKSLEMKARQGGYNYPTAESEGIDPTNSPAF